MKPGAYKALGVVTAIVIAAAAVVAWAMGGCTTPIETAAGGQVPMKCHWTMIAVVMVEAMGAFSALGLAFVKCKVGRRWLACGGVLAQALTLLALHTSLMGLCGDTTMHCHTTTLAVTVVAVVAVVLCVVAAALADPKRAELPKRGL